MQLSISRVSSRLPSSSSSLRGRDIVVVLHCCTCSCCCHVLESIATIETNVCRRNDADSNAEHTHTDPFVTGARAHNKTARTRRELPEIHAINNKKKYLHIGAISNTSVVCSMDCRAWNWICTFQYVLHSLSAGVYVHIICMFSYMWLKYTSPWDGTTTSTPQRNA